MSSITIGRLAGALFLLAFVVYMAGEALIVSGAGTPAMLGQASRSTTLIGAGAALMLANSAIVACIGVLMFPVLRGRHEISACAYLVTRLFEAVMLAVGVLCLLLLIPLAQAYASAGDGEALTSLAHVAQQGNVYARYIGMIGLGLGSLFFCRALLRTGLVPRFLAVWGLIGYATLAAGETLALLGYDVGLVHYAPGGLFEISLGLLLLIKGLPVGRRSPAVDTAGRDGEVTVVH